MSMGLSQNSSNAIRLHVEGFKTWLRREDGIDAIAGFTEGAALCDPILSREHLPTMSAEEFGIVLKDLWALNFWGNKDFKVQKVLQDNGLQKLKDQLQLLLYGEGTIGLRYDHFSRT